MVDLPNLGESRCVLVLEQLEYLGFENLFFPLFLRVGILAQLKVLGYVPENLVPLIIAMT